MSDAAIPHRLSAALTPSTISAGFLAVLISYAGPLLIYLQAARAMQIPEDVFSSWVFAISMAAGLSTLALSLWARAPVITAWSAPGTALLIAIGTGLPMAEITGAYIIAALTILAIGLTGLFDRLVRALPAPVSAGMMAGILFSFGVNAMAALGTAPVAFLILLTVFLLLRVLTPGLAVIGVLVLALGLTRFLYDIPLTGIGFHAPRLVVTVPEWSFAATLGLAVPLIIVTLSGQFLPGMAILRANGYDLPARPIIVLTALISVPAALLGGITTALASITIAFCASPEADADPQRRYGAGVACGLFYCLGAVLAGSVVTLITLLPQNIVAMLAGFALLGAIQKSLSDTLAPDDGAQAGLLSFMVTASGVNLFGISAAFWGVIAGLAAWHIGRIGRRLARRSRLPG